MKVLHGFPICLGGGVLVQRFGDLIRGRRSTPERIAENFMTPTLSAEPGDLSLVLPKRILDGIIEMIYALDKIAPGTANDDTLLYGVEVKFYNMEVQLDEHLETLHKGVVCDRRRKWSDPFSVSCICKWSFLWQERSQRRVGVRTFPGTSVKALDQITFERRY